MIPRTIQSQLVKAAQSLPVVAVLGPRQSGKTTLVRSVFPQHRYVSLEDLDVRSMAEQDPRGFLESYKGRVILDEIQRVPSLFSYLQRIVDERRIPGDFILTGSQNFLLMQSITQSLAGRIAMLELMPFSIHELQKSNNLPQSADELIYKGGFPRIHSQSIDPDTWIPHYVSTYVERDIYELLKIRDLTTFRNFLRLCAGRTGQLLNLSSLGAEAGVSHATIRSWISILEASYVIFLLPPYFQNFNKRIVKMPKIYFHDTGIACSLLGIRSPQDVAHSYMRGELFETMIVGDLYKQAGLQRRHNSLFFWRDKTGREVDLICDFGHSLMPIEIKSGATFQDGFLKNMNYWLSLQEKPTMPHLIMGGEVSQETYKGCVMKSWNSVGEILPT